MLVLVTLPFVVQAQFLYTTNNGTIAITGYTTASVDVTIPRMINGLPVTSIGGSAFYSYSPLKRVLIPNSVASIGELRI